MKIDGSARAIGILILCAGGCADPGSGRPEELGRVERQLDELYRPLLALVVESKGSVEDFMKTKLGRDYIFPFEKTREAEEVKLWLEKAEGDLMPRNERMCALIRSKRDLVDGPDLPPSWKALLEHQDGWRAVHEKWKKDHIPYSWHAPTSFPKRLESELETSIEKLEKRRDELKKPA
ncbi:MAG TPA: hypothetical protein VMU54_17685 [Planctomycetota bacterium]|nr:hypothetical protein [Planctomycetota bacterium]